MQPNEPEITNHKPVTDNSVILSAVETLLSSAGYDTNQLNVALDAIKYAKDKSLLNKKKESIQFFKSYIELQPNNIEAYYSLGICYREIGDIQMAEKTFLKALKMNTDYPYLKGQLQFMKNHLKN